MGPSDAQVEAAARAMYEVFARQHELPSSQTWDAISNSLPGAPDLRDQWRARARAGLIAAAALS